ncbi:MAG: hypothetical protein J6336_01460 [Kiritimatiellae bacterium]|nr:hypothetical protein [Kiritimatiellia bacterium]
MDGVSERGETFHFLSVARMGMIASAVSIGSPVCRVAAARIPVRRVIPNRDAHEKGMMAIRLLTFVRFYGKVIVFDGPN